MDAISIKTDYEVLKSLIKIKDLITYAKANNINSLGVIDNNLSSSIEFYEECKKNNIKPLIALDVTINDHIYIFAKNYQGLKDLFKLNTYLLDNTLAIEVLSKYITNTYLVTTNINLYNELSKMTSNLFLGVKNINDAKEIKNKIIFNIARTLKREDTKYLSYLREIDGDSKENLELYKNDYLIPADNKHFTDLINIEIKGEENLIPHYDINIKDSYKYLEGLSAKGLTKRLNGNVPDNYKQRLIYELSVIKKMGFTDYFLIVYDYVKYAITHNILVGPGRGSAAGSLVTYSLGITQIDPIKYDLLFERFLNPGRITMPDIDIDFDAEKRGEMISYVKERYGATNAMPIMTYGTFASKQALLSVSKILNIDISTLSPLIDAKKTLKENLTKEVISLLNNNQELKKVYYEATKIEGLKKHISTHAAGVVISSKQLDEIIPIIKSGDNYLTGYTMNYLESLGLLKMDFLAIKDLTTISNILESINPKININKISLNDEKVFKAFSNAQTVGIFQFESEGMKNFLRRLKPNTFTDLSLALALYRPGPMQSIDSFINRRNGKEKVTYIEKDLESILKETYGIIIYQEQIMQIFNKLASYTYAEADLIRRAISKKKEDIIINEKEKFITRSVNNGYQKEKAEKIYDLIMKFASYGFNKSHSVAYAMLAYQMMYLKINYPKEFYASLLTININTTKTKEYIDEAKTLGLKILKPDINKSTDAYTFEEDGIRMPLTIIKNIGPVAIKEITEERKKSEFTDFTDFVSRIYNKGINTKTIENLIYAGVFDEMGETRNTLLASLKNVLIYAELVSGVGDALVSKPELIKTEELPPNELMQKEIELFGFYVSNHPASKYNCVKFNNIKEYFDKNIETVGLLEKIKTIKTKKGDTMAFLDLTDETGTISATIFPNRIIYINQIKTGDLLKIYGHVEKRLDRYQIIINKIEIKKI